MYIPFIKDNRLYSFFDIFGNFTYTGRSDVLSILLFDGKKRATVKLTNGEIVNVNLKRDLCKKSRPQSYINFGIIRRKKYRIFFCNAFLLISDEQIWNFVTTEIMQQIKDVACVDNEDFDIQIKFNDGHVEKFNVILNKQTRQLVSENGRIIDIHFNLNTTNVFCKYGKMEEVGFTKCGPDSNLILFLVKTDSGDYYKFEYPFSHKSCNKLFIHKPSNSTILTYNNSVFVYGAKTDAYIINIPREYLFIVDNPIKYPYAIGTGQFIETPDVEIMAQNGSELFAYTSKRKVVSLKLKSFCYIDDVIKIDLYRYGVYGRSTITYYVTHTGYLINITDDIEMTRMISFKNKYYSWFNLSELEILPIKLPIEDAVVVEISSIHKHANTIIINRVYPILNKFVMEIDDIILDCDFTPYDALVIMRSGARRKCCMAFHNKCALLVFNDGEIVEIMPKCEKYSQYGKYTHLSPDNYKAICGCLYEVQNNLVLFPNLERITHIYEFCGEYIGYDEVDNRNDAGHIIIHHKLQTIKPAAHHDEIF